MSMMLGSLQRDPEKQAEVVQVRHRRDIQFMASDVIPPFLRGFQACERDVSHCLSSVVVIPVGEQIVRSRSTDMHESCA